MSTLSACIRRAGKALNKDDADAIKVLRDELRADGLEHQQAAIDAVVGHIESLLAEHGDLTSDASYRPELPHYAQHTAPDTKSAEPDAPAKEVPDAPVPNEKAEDVAAHGSSTGKIENFGEKLHGSRADKETARTTALIAGMDDKEIAASALSKLWPKETIDGIEDHWLAAFAHAARAEIPSKPRTTHKLNRWVETVKLMSSLFTNATTDSARVKELLKDFNSKGKLQGFSDKVELLAELEREHWPRIDSIEPHPNAYRYTEENNADGKPVKIPSPFTSIRIDGNYKRLDGADWREHIPAIKELLGETQDNDTRIAFEVRGRPGAYNINKKGDREYRKVAGPFADPKEAFAYLKDSYADVLKSWEAIKERDNVGKTDMRNAENKPRTGKDYRDGKNIAPEDFHETFGFRGTEFGKWVSQGKGNKERQGLLNHAYDALMDLANILGIPPKAISLNGTLGIAFGSRGHGWAGAHFEPTNLVINLTKTRGAGALAHEWFHALDRYFQQLRGEDGAYSLENGFITYRPKPRMVHKKRPGLWMTRDQLDAAQARHPESGQYAEDQWQVDPNHHEGVRPEVENAFGLLVRALDQSPMAERAKTIDEGKKEGYWSRIIERAARSFENYIISKMADGGYDNDYLANIKGWNDWSKNPERYPYLKPEELPPIKEAFDNLFSTIEARETDTGVGLFRVDDEPVAVLNGTEIDATGDPVGAARKYYSTHFQGKEADSPAGKVRFSGKGWHKLKRGLTTDPLKVRIIPAIKDIIERGEYHGREGLYTRRSDDVVAFHFFTGNVKIGDKTVQAGVSVAEDSRGNLFYNLNHDTDALWEKIKPQSERNGLARKIEAGDRRLPGSEARGADLNVIVDPFNSEINTEQAAPISDLKPAGSVTPSDVQAIVDKIAASWGIKPHVLQSASVLPETAQMEMRNQGITGGITGYYDRKTQSIYLVADAMKNKADAQKTLLHEGVGHLGIERVMGKDINKFLRSVYDARGADPWTGKADPIIQAAWEYVNQPKTYGDARPIVKSAEMVARIAESDPKHNLVQRFIQMVRQALRKMGFNIPFTSNDIIEALRRAKRSLEDGSYAGEGAAGGLFQAAHHGSPHRFEKFSTDFIGTGEGNQAFGWGIYTAGNQLVAESYRDGITANKRIGEINKELSRLSKIMDENSGPGYRNFRNETGREAARQYDDLMEKRASRNFDDKGALYAVDVPEDHELLDWDALMPNQPPGVLEKLMAADFGGDPVIAAWKENGTWDHINGEYLYKRMAGGLTVEAQRAGKDKQASLYLKSIGIPGLRYLDEFSRKESPPVPAFEAWAGYHKGVDLDTASEAEKKELRAEYDDFANAEDTRTRNFVIFDDERIEITDTLFRAKDQTDSPAFRKWFGDSKVVDENGEPLAVYHATDANFAVFSHVYTAGQMGFHFGSAEQAENVSENSVVTVPAYLAIKNPIRLEDLGAWQGSEVVAMVNRLAGTDLHPSARDSAIRAALRLKGFDGVVYENRFEGEGDSYIAFLPSQIKSALGNNGDFDAGNPNILFRVEDTEEANSQTVSRRSRRSNSQGGNSLGGISYSYGGNQGGAAPFRSPADSLADTVIRKWQDKFRPLLNTQREIEKAGGNVNETNDVYRAEEAFYGKTEEELRQLSDDYLQPLADSMAEEKVSREELDLYLMARHAPERNAHIAEINPNMPDGGSGMTDAEAEAIMARFASEGRTANLEAVAGHVDSLLQKQRDLYREGLLDESVTDAWEEAYDHYVPLKGFADDEGGGGFGTGKGFDIRGKETLRAMGRRSMPESPVLHAIKDTTAAVIRKRKNEVGNSLLKLIQDNPNPDYWDVFTDENPDTHRRIVKTADGDEVRNMPMPMAMMPDKYFATKKDGKVYYIKLEDPRLMKAMKNMGPESLGAVMRGMATVTRFLSSMSTSYNPEFMVSNSARDIQTAVLNLLAEQDLPDGKAHGKSLALKMVKSVPMAIRAIHASLYNKQLTGTAAQWQATFDQFREDGAKTGWFDQKDIDGQAAELERMIDIAQGGGKGNALKAIKLIKDIVEHANTSVENGVRLSVYKHAIDAGVSRKKAASLAKNLTVNFNRKGEIGPVLNAMYMFANASVQGTANFARTVGTFKTDANGKRSLNMAQKAAAALVAASFGLALLNRMMAGDDDDEESWWDKVPQYVRERNIVIMKSVFGGPEGEYYTFPLPYGYNVFYNLGDTMEATINSDTRSAGELATGMTMAILGSFSPIGMQDSDNPGIAALKTATPTVLAPFVQLAINENFYGAPIYPENFDFGVPEPKSSLSKASTKAHWRAVAEWMNEATGGSMYRSGAVDVQPDALEHLFNFTTGSAGAFYSRLLDAGKKAVTGEAIEAPEIPFARRLSGKVSAYGDTDNFYKRRDEIGQIKEELKNLRGQEATEFRAKFKDKIRLIGPMGAAEKQLRVLRKARRAAMEREQTPATKLRIKEIESRMNAVVDRFNKQYKQARS